jgi:hypothetical protein
MKGWARWRRASPFPRGDFLVVVICVLMLYGIAATEGDPALVRMYAGHGLFMNDAIVFHNMAVEIARRIHANGWSEWLIYLQKIA